MFKRLLMTFAMVALVPFAACAQEATEYEEGTHYTLIQPPIRTANPDKIGVTEFFWYGCIHCYNMEPMVIAWKKNLGDDVEFRGSPAIWNGPMELHAKAFYAAEALGVMDKLHPALFAAMNVDRKRLLSEEEIAEVFEANGVSAEDFTKAFNSFGVGSQARQAGSRARAAKITGTPEFMVNGKYRVSSRTAGGQANMLKVAQYLIEKERAAKQ